MSDRPCERSAASRERGVFHTVDATNAQAVPTRPKMPNVTVKDDADSIEDLERVDEVAHTPHNT